MLAFIALLIVRLYQFRHDRSTAGKKTDMSSYYAVKTYDDTFSCLNVVRVRNKRGADERTHKQTELLFCRSIS